MTDTNGPSGPPPIEEQELGVPQLIIAHYPDGRTEVGASGDNIDFATALSMLELAKFQMITQYLHATAMQRAQAEQPRILTPSHQPAILRPTR